MHASLLTPALAALSLGLTGCISEGALDEPANAPAPAAVTVSPPAPEAPAETDKASAELPAEVTGRTLREVRFGEKKARFAETYTGVWTEYNENGEAFNTFKETGRDDWSVYLLDDTRGIRLQLDVHRDMILLGQRGGEMADQWAITDAALKVSPPYTAEGATGRNLAMAAFGDKAARFQKNKDNTWTEFSAEGQPFNTFREDRRDDWSVYLVDDSRNIRIQLDVHRKMILLGQNGGDMADQWAMTDYGQRT